MAVWALADLRELGVEVRMLTGNNPRTAAAVARELGIIHFRGGVTPQDKHAEVESLQAAGRVASTTPRRLPRRMWASRWGAGTDVAMESAGVTLVKGDLVGIVRAIRLGQAMMRNIRQNLFFAFAYNAVGIPLAAGVLYPVFGVLLSPMIAGVAMSLSSVSVVGNALRLRNTAR